MSPEQQGVLRVPRVADGAVGRPGVDRLHRRHGDRRGARPQRPAAVALLRDQGRPGHHGVGGRRARHPAEDIVVKERLQPGRMFLVDTAQGRIVADEEIKQRAGARAAVRRVAEAAPDRHRRRCRPAPYLPRAGPRDGAAAPAGVRLHARGPAAAARADGARTARSRSARWAPTRRWRCCRTGRGCSTTTSSSCSRRSPTRRSTRSARSWSRRWSRRSARSATCSSREPESVPPDQASTYPIIDNEPAGQAAPRPRCTGFSAITLPMLFRAGRTAPRARARARRAVRAGASDAVDAGLHDPDPVRPRRRRRAARRSRACWRRPACTITWCAQGTRTRCALVVESGDAREVHHCRAAARLRRRRGQSVPGVRDARRHDPAAAARRASRTTQAVNNYIKALNKGILKVMSKMGISTLQSYCGAQIFEAIGLEQAFVDRYFTRTASRIGGVGLDVIAEEVLQRHAHAFPTGRPAPADLDAGGEYQWRRDGEYHLFNPETVFKLQHATRSGQYAIFKEYTRAGRRPEPQLGTLRGLLDFKPAAAAGPDRRGRAGRGDRQALRDRRDVVRLDQPGGARDAGDRDEPDRRQVEHRRRRRGSGALHARRRTATRGAARSSRWPRRASA